MQGRQIVRFGLFMTLALAIPWITAQRVMAADPITAELAQQAELLVSIVKDGAEEGGAGNPIIVDVKCGNQSYTQRCEEKEALVPFLTGGPGSAVWYYVALFRILPEETEFQTTAREFNHQSLKHVAIVTFSFVPEPFGIIDWDTAQVKDGYVLVQTRHWTDRDGHANPSGPGMVRIDLQGGIKLTNLP
jgi:hypothetical protein